MDTDDALAGIATRVDGEDGAPALLCCNSLGTSLSMWDLQVPQWSRHHRVIRFDASGHGGSATTSGPTTIETLGRDALAVLDAHGVGSADLCGLSLGGLVALWLAIHHPERVDRLVIACSAARIGTRTRWEERAALVRSDGMDAIAGAVVGRFFTAGFRERDPGTVADVERTLRAVEPEGYAGACLALATADLRTDLGRVGAATLVIAGSEDVATPTATVAELHAGIAGARWLELSGAGHLANIEAPDRFTTAVTAFLTDGSTRRPSA